MAVDISVVIVNYNVKSLIKDCIKSIKEYTTGVNYEIIVVDNASEDISELQSSTVRTLQLDENLGFGRANNVGAKMAKGNVLFFLNPDTIFVSNAISILYEALTTIPESGVCGANLYDADYKPAHSYFYCTMSLKHAFRCLIKSASKINHISNQHNFSDTIKCVEYITGADLMISKDLFNEIGGFNDGIFMYYEDVDLCVKVRHMHKKCYSIPQAKILHLEGQSFNPIQNNLDYINKSKLLMTSDSVAVFLRSNYKKSHYKFIIFVNILILWGKKAVLRILSKNQSGVIRQLEFFKYIRGQL